MEVQLNIQATLRVITQRGALEDLLSRVRNMPNVIGAEIVKAHFHDIEVVVGPDESRCVMARLLQDPEIVSVHMNAQ